MIPAVRLIIEAFGRRVVDLELLPPPSSLSPQSAAHDAHSTTASQVEQANDGVNGPFGFAPVIKAER